MGLEIRQASGRKEWNERECMKRRTEERAVVFFLTYSHVRILAHPHPHTAHPHTAHTHTRIHKHTDLQPQLRVRRKLLFATW